MHEEESKTQIDSQKVITEPPLKTEKPQDGENDDDPAAESDGTLTQCVVHENVSGSLLQEMPQCSMTPDSMSVSCSGFEPEEGLDTSKQTRSLPFAPPENLLKVVDDKKEGLSDGKAEDRQSKTPSPSACAHSSGTSSTSDIEVLDHDSVVSETSGGSRTEQKNMLPLVHSFQLSEQFSRDGERVGTLDDTRLYESGSSASTDGFERIDASSLRSLESRSVSEMNSDEEAIPGASAQVLVSTSQGEEPSGSDPDVQQADSDVAEDRERVADLLCTESEETFDFPIVNVQCIDGDVAGAESEKAATSLQGSDVSYEMDRSTTPVYEDSYGGCMLDIVDHAEIAKARTGVEVDAQPAYCSFTEKEMRNEMFQVEEPDKRTVLVDQPDGSPRVQTEKSDRNELHNIVSDLTQRLNTREDQLLTVNKEKARLEEIHDNLQDELTRLQQESKNIVSLKAEFMHRIGDAERKAQAACRERDAIKKELKQVKEQLSIRPNTIETAELLREKDEQIKGLLEEGDKLSKQQLQNSTIIKKLRAKEKEHEAQQTKQSKRVASLEEKLRDWQQVFEQKEEVDKQQRESIRRLSVTLDKQKEDREWIQSELQDLKEKNQCLESTLDTTFQELSEVRRANAARDCEAQEEQLSCEIQAKEQMRLALEKQQDDAKRQQEALVAQVTDLRLALCQAEQQQALMEERLRQEIVELHSRLQDAENRNQELGQSMGAASRPLLRQIESLQAMSTAQATSWEKLEKNLTDRLAEAQSQLAVVMERERNAQEEALQLRTETSALNSQVGLLRQERGRLQVQLEAERSRAQEIQEEMGRHAAELESLRLAQARVLEEACRDKALMEKHLEVERAKVEAEKKKALLAQEALKERNYEGISLAWQERKFHRGAPGDVKPDSPTLTRSNSLSLSESFGSFSGVTQQQDETDYLSAPVFGATSSVYDAMRLGAGSTVMERLQSQLKRQGGEISQFQTEISTLEQSRTIMTEELVKLTTENEDLLMEVSEVPKLKTELQDLQQRYNTMLQMYGEKAEEAEELRLDLEDVKNLYKAQIEELLQYKQQRA
uniref:TATA element modulatory factor 1 n=1 Tax=Eptatretus burgeri TaxID=7764 RepID=A0A8C4QWC8_EPTBU